jgi:hypothetical protein
MAVQVWFSAQQDDLAHHTVWGALLKIRMSVFSLQIARSKS